MADPTAPTVNVLTTINQYLSSAWVDQVLRSNFFFGEVLSNTEAWKGSQMLFQMKYQKGVATVAFNGYDVLPTNQQPVSVNMTFYPVFTATNVALAGSDISVNQSPMQVLDLIKITMKSRAQDGADDIGNFFQSNGQAFSGKAPAGLGNIVDNGSVSSTYGGLSRATYAGLNATVTNSSGTISLLKVRQLSNTITDDLIAPTMALTEYNVWSYFEQLLQPFQRNTYSDEFRRMKAGAGYEGNNSIGGVGLIWDGLTIYRDKKVTSGNFYLLNLDYLKFHGLNWWQGNKVGMMDKQIEGNIYSYINPSSSSKAFTWSGFIDAYNMGAVNGFMIMGGQLICTNPFRNGLLYGVTGV